MTLCSLKLSYAPAVAVRPSARPFVRPSVRWCVRPTTISRHAPTPSIPPWNPQFHFEAPRLWRLSQNRASCCEPHLRSIFNLNRASSPDPWDFPCKARPFSSFNCAQKINLNNIYAYALFDLNKFRLFCAPPLQSWLAEPVEWIWWDRISWWGFRLS